MKIHLVTVLVTDIHLRGSPESQSVHIVVVMASFGAISMQFSGNCN